MRYTFFPTLIQYFEYRVMSKTENVPGCVEENHKHVFQKHVLRPRRKLDMVDPARSGANPAQGACVGE